jgi:peptidyl-tRNA hydrolase
MGTPSTAQAATPDRSRTWVQPIVVAKSGHHEETVWLGARASAAIYLEEKVLGDPLSHEEATRLAYRFHLWLSGPFTKTVRRASQAQMEAVIRWARVTRTPFVRFASGDAVEGSAAIALPPMRYGDLPRRIARLQVSGTDLPRLGTGWSAWQGGLKRSQGWPPVDLFVDEQLTTGKATAQAAHALWMWMLDIERAGTATTASPALLAWADAGYPASLTFCDEVELVRGLDLIEHQPHHDRPSRADTQRAFPVRDAGLTEVAPNTLTAVAVAHSNPERNLA